MGLDIGGIFGGGSGGILGAVMDVASIAFPELKLAGAIMNLLGQAFGKGVAEGLDKAMEQLGLPKFLADAVKQALQEAFGQKQTTSPQQDQAAQGQYGQAAQQFADSVAQQVVQQLQNSQESQPDSASGGKKGWLRAMAEAFGNIANKAAKELEVMGKNINQGDPKSMTDYQAATQEFSQMMNTFTNALKTIGEADANTVRKG